MKMRLIDADLLKKDITKWLKHMIDVADAIVSTMMEIDEQPTAFDVDKVVEQLEREKAKAELLLSEDMGTGFEFASKCRLDAYKKAIEIVKNACIDEITGGEVDGEINKKIRQQ